MCRKMSRSRAEDADYPPSRENSVILVMRARTCNGTDRRNRLPTPCLGRLSIVIVPTGGGRCTAERNHTHARLTLHLKPRCGFGLLAPHQPLPFYAGIRGLLVNDRVLAAISGNKTMIRNSQRSERLKKNLKIPL